MRLAARVWAFSLAGLVLILAGPGNAVAENFVTFDVPGSIPGNTQVYGSTTSKGYQAILQTITAGTALYANRREIHDV